MTRLLHAPTKGSDLSQKFIFADSGRDLRPLQLLLERTYLRRKASAPVRTDATIELNVRLTGYIPLRHA